MSGSNYNYHKKMFILLAFTELGTILMELIICKNRIILKITIKGRIFEKFNLLCQSRSLLWSFFFGEITPPGFGRFTQSEPKRIRIQIAEVGTRVLWLGLESDSSPVLPDSDSDSSHWPQDSDSDSSHWCLDSDSTRTRTHGTRVWLESDSAKLH